MPIVYSPLLVAEGRSDVLLRDCAAGDATYHYGFAVLAFFGLLGTCGVVWIDRLGSETR